MIHHAAALGDRVEGEAARRVHRLDSGRLDPALERDVDVARVEFQTEPLPKSPVGKVRRKELRDPHWEGRERKVGGV